MFKALCALALGLAAMPAAALAQGISARDAWSRATPAAGDVGAVYLTIENRGFEADRLLGASTEAARNIEIHRTSITDGIARMRPVKELVIAPGETAILHADGHHLMLFGLEAPLSEGQALAIDLTFENAGTVRVLAEVRSLAAGADPHADHAGHQHGAAAPIGVMGEHMHGAGEWMLSYRYMRMDMGGNRIGTNGVTAETIVTTIANPHAGPATLRVVPTRMTTDMHMFGLMGAPTDWLTLMAMGSYQRKEMDHITFQGMAGTTVLGEFTARSSGAGDTRLTGLMRLYDDGAHHIHLNAGLSLPTGSISETDTMLAPTNMRPRLRLPYAMQLGSGTYDLLPGVTYTGSVGGGGWGAQYAGNLRLGENDADYSLGDEHRLNLWGSRQFGDWLTASLRLRGSAIGRIDGQDSAITAPVQTANPDNYGGKRLDVSFGFTLAPPYGPLQGHSLGLEVVVPAYQDLNGPQMESDWMVMVGWKFMFGPL